MPSSPRIPKETILEHALQILIREGYAALNIKALANEIGCSTQPISWHFGNMDGLRKELGEYALHYVNERMYATTKDMEGFAKVGIAYINIAFDEPKLFRYLYMSGDGGCLKVGFDSFVKANENAAMVDRIAKQLKISRENAGIFCRNMIIYTHGLASYIASGLIEASREEVCQMMHQGTRGFLLQLGAEWNETI